MTKDIARREGLIRARVCHIRSLLRLAPAIQKHIVSAHNTTERSAISERSLRRITVREDCQEQLLALQEIVERSRMSRHLTGPWPCSSWAAHTPRFERLYTKGKTWVLMSVNPV